MIRRQLQDIAMEFAQGGTMPRAQKRNAPACSVARTSIVRSGYRGRWWLRPEMRAADGLEAAARTRGAVARRAKARRPRAPARARERGCLAI